MYSDLQDFFIAKGICENMFWMWVNIKRGKDPFRDLDDFYYSDWQYVRQILKQACDDNQYLTNLCYRILNDLNVRLNRK